MIELKGVLIGYARVSTDIEKIELQVDELIKAGVEPGRIYTDHVSGGPGTSRSGFVAARRACSKDATLVVCDLDRLGRSLVEVLTVCADLRTKGVGLRILTGGLDTRTKEGKLLLHQLSDLAGMERRLILERTKAGQAEAKAKGRVGGRSRTVTPAMEAEAIEMLKAGVPVPIVAEHLNVSKSLIYQRARDEWAPRIAEAKNDG